MYIFFVLLFGRGVRMRLECLEYIYFLYDVHNSTPLNPKTTTCDPPKSF